MLRAFALSRSFVIGLSFILRVGMPMFSRLFALMNDQNVEERYIPSAYTTYLMTNYTSVNGNTAPPIRCREE